MKQFICLRCEAQGKEVVGSRRFIRAHIKEDHITIRSGGTHPQTLQKLRKYQSLDPKTVKIVSKVSAMMAEAVEDDAK